MPLAIEVKKPTEAAQLVFNVSGTNVFGAPGLSAISQVLVVSWVARWLQGGVFCAQSHSRAIVRATGGGHEKRSVLDPLVAALLGNSGCTARLCLAVRDRGTERQSGCVLAVRGHPRFDCDGFRRIESRHVQQRRAGTGKRRARAGYSGRLQWDEGRRVGGRAGGGWCAPAPRVG